MKILKMLTRRSKNYKQRQNRCVKLNNNPQIRGICIKIFSINPKKPNSANRKVTKVRIPSTKQIAVVKIPGELHSLQQHSIVLIKGARIRDLIGVRYNAIRGKFDLAGVRNRSNSRSLYGVKKTKN